MVRKWLKKRFAGSDEAPKPEVETAISANNQSARSNKPGSYSFHELADESDDLIKGWRFVVPMNLTTPLEFLLRHGEVSDTRKDEPLAFGIWMPILKPWEELGIRFKSIDTVEKMASDIGLIPTDGGQFLPFLIKYRQIVESDTERVDTLTKLAELEQHYPEFTAKLGGDLCKLLVLSELRTLPGCGEKTAEKLYKAGYISKTQVIEASVDKLISVPGIGHSTVQKMKR